MSQQLLANKMSRVPVRDVFVATHTLNDVIPLLQKSLPQVSFRRIDLVPPSGSAWRHTLPEADVQKLKMAEILITDNQTIPQIADCLPQLKWVQGTFAGVELVLKRMKEAVRSGSQKPRFIATRFSGQRYGQLMFEYALSFIISNERGFSKFIRSQPHADWTESKAQSSLNFRLINELTVTVLGLGAIGSFVTKSLKQMGCRVKGFSRTEKSEEFVRSSGVDIFSTDIRAALGDTDYIINILPHSPQTIGLLDDVLSACNRSPVLINLGRGSVVSGKSLLSALDEGFVSGAVLDVFETEPLPADSPLWSHPRILITPHIGAETRVQDLAELFVQNYQLLVENKPLMFVIDWTQDY